MDEVKLDFRSTSVPPTEPIIDSGPLITDHVFSGVHVNAFDTCDYCKRHYAKHLYQSSGIVYQPVPYTTPFWQIPPYQSVWIGDYPYAQPTVTYNIHNSADSNG